MKIVFVGPFGLRPKGTMLVRALPLAKALTRRGHTVTVLIPPWDDPERAGQSWVEDGTPVENLDLPPAWPGLFHLELTRALAARALALQPDVVHCFKPKAYAGLTHLALWLRRRLGLDSPRLVVDADDWEQAWNERLPYPAWQKRFFTWQERWGLRHAEAVTVASRAGLELVAGVRGHSDGLFYVPNGYVARPEETELTAAQVRQQWELGSAPTILLYSRFAEFRLGRIVTLVRETVAALPSVRWLVVGQGLQGEEQELARRLSAAGLERFVRFAGWRPASELPAYFAAADVAAFPYDDTLINRTKCSVKLIDLLAAGRPVVADAVGQNCEYIQPGRSGLLVPAEDDAAFSRALIDLLQAPDRRDRLGREAALAIQHRFTWAHLAQAVEKAYQ